MAETDDAASSRAVSPTEGVRVKREREDGGEDSTRRVQQRTENAAGETNAATLKT